MKYNNLRPLHERIFVTAIEQETNGWQLTNETKFTVRDWRIVSVGNLAPSEFKVGQKIRTPAKKEQALPHDKSMFTIMFDDVLYIDNEDGTFTLPNAEILVEYDKPSTMSGGFKMTESMAKEYNNAYTATIKAIGTQANKEGEGYYVGCKILCDEKTGTPLMLGGDKSEWYSVKAGVHVLAVFDAE